MTQLWILIQEQTKFSFTRYACANYAMHLQRSTSFPLLSDVQCVPHKKYIRHQISNTLWDNRLQRGQIQPTIVLQWLLELILEWERAGIFNSLLFLLCAISSVERTSAILYKWQGKCQVPYYYQMNYISWFFSLKLCKAETQSHTYKPRGLQAQGAEEQHLQHSCPCILGTSTGSAS